MTKTRSAALQAVIRFGLVAYLIAACTGGEPTPTPSPTPTETPTQMPTPSPVPTIAPTSTPLPTATPLTSQIPRVLARADELVYVRAEPNTLLPVTGVFESNQSWQAVGRTNDNQWLEVLYGEGESGWIVHLPGEYSIDLLDLPVSGQSVILDQLALVTADSQPFYNDAGDELLGELPHLSSLQVDRRTENNAWLHGTDSEGRTGWVATQGMLAIFPLESMPIGEFTLAIVAEPNARVRVDSGGLRLRQAPSTTATVLLNLMAGTELVVAERTTDNAWALVELKEGYRGWVSTFYLELIDIRISDVPANDNPQPVEYFVPPTPEGGPSVVVVNSGAGAIFQNGQAMGNRAHVFTTVGDSLTDTPYFLRGIVNGFNLGEYGYLLPVINYFNADTGLGNAFARRAISTRAGWSSFSVVVEERPELAGTCNPGEKALECEYRLTKPAYAVVMIGTNDAPAFGADSYRANMTRIIEISIANGVVPILSTLPPRAQFNDRILEYNAVIVQLAGQYGVPFTDLYSALVNLPNQGLDPDGVHLSIPPGAPASTLNFNAANLRYGTTMRNLTVLQALAQVRSQIG
jgi:uncharacterized protein YgiM (DUF1202 family)